MCQTHLLLHSICFKYSWCISSEDLILASRRSRVLRRFSFFLKAPRVCNELNPAELIFSHRRLPSHDLCGLFCIVRPELMKPGMMSTGKFLVAILLQRWWVTTVVGGYGEVGCEIDINILFTSSCRGIRCVSSPLGKLQRPLPIGWLPRVPTTNRPKAR